VNLGNSTSKRVLNQFEPMYLGIWKVIIQKSTVVKFSVYNESCDKTGCFGIKVRTGAYSEVRECEYNRI